MERMVEKIATIIREEFPEIGEFHLEEREVFKTNRAITGITLVTKENQICPTVYPPATYDPGIAKKLAYALVDGVKSTAKIGEDINAIRDFAKCREKILCFAVNTAKNKNYIANRPYIDRGELAECFYLPFKNEEMGEGTIMVTDAMMKAWGATPELLHTCAEENIKRDLVMDPLASALEAMGMGMELEMTPPPVMVCTTRTKTNGAGIIFFPHLLREKLGTEDEYYIIPSSIHEILLFPKQETEAEDVEMERDHLKKMIFEVNRTALAPEEFLSDNLFCLEGDFLSDLGCFQP